MDFYVYDIDTYINVNSLYWHGKGKTKDELLSSTSSRDKVILETIKRDEKREIWFKENGLKLRVVWENEIENF
jgi:G:T-mismatch repair DNA endonuclease (very short patch repair protein)